MSNCITNAKNTIMIPKSGNSYAYDDLIQHCFTSLETNFAQFLNYSKHLEELRSKLLTTNDEYKILKSWLHTVNEDIIKESKFEHTDLTQLYEILLKNNSVQAFYSYTNDRKTIRLKFVEKMNESKNLETGLNVAKEDITSLKTEYNNLTQRYEVSENNLAKPERFLDYANDHETLRLKFKDTIDECKRLKSRLDSAYEGITMLNSEYDDASRRYQVLLEDTTVQEFLNCAKYQETSYIGQADEIITSLRSELKEARKMLQIVENERDSLDFLSERLRRLLSKYPRRKLPAEKKQKCRIVDELIKGSTNESEVQIKKSDDDIVFVDMEVIYEPSTVTASEVEESFHFSNSFSDIVDFPNSPEKKYDETVLLSNVSKEHDSFIQDPISNERVEKPSSSCVTSKSSITQARSNYTPDGKIVTKSTKPRNTRNRIQNSNPAIKISNSTMTPNQPLALKCNVCRESFTSKTDIMQHFIRCHMKERLFRCEKCGESFTESNSEQSTLKCPTCDVRSITLSRKNRTKSTTNPLEMNENCESANIDDIHIEPSETSTNHCDTCDRNYASKFTLQQHMRTVHAVEKPFQCEICGVQFAIKFYLDRHKVVHGLKKPTSCDICDRDYVSNFILQQHIRTVHRGEKPYQCETCGKRFGLKNYLERHKLVHETNRPFKCTICNRCFKDSSNLKRHIRAVHTRVTPYSCAHCDKRCAAKSALRYHIHTSHFSGVLKQYKCVICDKSYALSHDLKRHQVRHNHVEGSTNA